MSLDSMINEATAEAHTLWQNPSTSADEGADATLQVRLCRYYGPDPDVQWHALGVISNLGIVFDAEEAEQAVEAFCRMLVHGSLIMGHRQMAIGPVIELARRLTATGDAQPLRAAGMLAAAAISPTDNDPQLTHALAMAIAKGCDDCEIVHDLLINVLELWRKFSRDLLERKVVLYPPEPRAPLPVAAPDPEARTRARSKAWSNLREAVSSLEYGAAPKGDEVSTDPFQLVEVAPRHAMSERAGVSFADLAPALEPLMRELIDDRLRESDERAAALAEHNQKPSPVQRVDTAQALHAFHGGTVYTTPHLEDMRRMLERHTSDGGDTGSECSNKVRQEIPVIRDETNDPDPTK